MAKYKAILFDVDGTLLDTKEFVFQAFKHAMKLHYDREITWEDDLTPLMGKMLDVMFQRLTGENDVDRLITTYRDFQSKNLHLSNPYKDTKYTLEKLKQSGFKLAAVSSRSSENVQTTLELAGIMEYLDVIITGDIVKNPKPDPEPVRLALTRLGVEPEFAVMVGDTDVDILAGKSAGVSTIGVTYGAHGAGIKDFAPDFVINNISEILPLILN